MKILVVGSGGREHALCWTLAASPLCQKLYCAPGNAGIAQEATLVDIKANDCEELVSFAQKQAIDLVVVGPEEPLVLGLADSLRACGIRVVGPSAAAAQLEGSKGYMKDLCRKYAIPTATYERFSGYEAAAAYIKHHGAPIVVKTDGLAAGKGVTVATSVEEALAAARDALLDKKFGPAGEELVIEEFLEGEELSFFALCDGETALPLASVQDHKAVYDQDKGPNTGGMGAYSPAPVCTPEVEQQIIETILTPTLAAMKAEGTPYQGILFLGLMVTQAGPKLIEYNIRFGDPECQVLMMRLMSDLVPALIACADGALADFDLRWYEQAALTVVLASQGYPGAYEKGSVIQLPQAPCASFVSLSESSNNVIENLSETSLEGEESAMQIFHAGTARNDMGDLIAVGGRVLNATASGTTVAEAQKAAYRLVDQIEWPQGFCRRDIGWRAIR